MGALASAGQLKDVREQIGKLHKQARIVSGNPDHVFPGHEKGAFMEPVLLRTDTPWTADAVHAVEAFGPVSTIMPYMGLDDAIALANRGMGSLASSPFTFANTFAEELVSGLGAYHGRMSIPAPTPT